MRMTMALCWMIALALLGCVQEPEPTPAVVYAAARAAKIREVMGFDPADTLVVFKRSEARKTDWERDRRPSHLTVVVSNEGRVVRFRDERPSLVRGELEPSALEALRSAISIGDLCRFEPGVASMFHSNQWTVTLRCDGATDAFGTMRTYGSFQLPATSDADRAAQSDRLAAIEALGLAVESLTETAIEPIVDKDGRAALGGFERDLAKFVHESWDLSRTYQGEASPEATDSTSRARPSTEDSE